MTDFEAALIAQVTRCAAALEGIWQRLDAVELVQDESVQDAPAECAHPPDQRIDFGVTDGQPDWQCGVCGRRSIEPPTVN